MIDHTVVERAIQVSIAQQKHQPVVVSCPTGVKARKGLTFACVAAFSDGNQTPFVVTALDDKGNVHYFSAAVVSNGAAPHS